MNKYILFIALLIAEFATESVCQMQAVRDLQLWTAIEINKKIGKRWDIHIGEQVRLEHNASRLDEFFTELGAGYDVSDRIKISTGVRAIRHLTSSGDFENRIRAHADLRYRKGWDRLELTFRTRVQSRWEPDEEKNKNRWRNRIQADWNLPGSKVDPWVYAELFVALPGQDLFGYEGFRFATGVDWKLPGPHVITIFYLLEREQQPYFPFTANRLGVKYQLDL